MRGESCGGPGAPRQMGSGGQGFPQCCGFWQEGDGDILVLERVTQGPQHFPLATGQTAGVQCPCRALCQAQPELGPVLPAGMMWSIPASFSSILPSQRGSSRHVQAAARQELPGGAGPILGPFPRSYSRVPFQGPIPASPKLWVPGQARRGLVDAGSSAVLYGLRGLH